MMKNAVCLLLLVILALFLTGCVQKPSEELIQTDEELTAALSIDPFPPAVMKPITLLLALNDSAGQAIDDAQIAYDLSMPGMEMPPNRPQVSPESGGRYRAEAIFTMTGDWQAQAIVTHNEKTTTFTFDISVK